MEVIRSPFENVWNPGIVLHSNMDGKFDPTLHTNALINGTDGSVEWMPPGIFRTKCKIDIKLFPFDWQNCSLSFRPYYYDKTEVVLSAKRTQTIIDHYYYQRNGEWDLVFCPATAGDADDDHFSEVRFIFVFKRKPLFYIITYVIPCVLITMLSIGTFVIPSASSQKIHLAISVFMGLSVYLSMLAKRTPETQQLPLISRFLMVSMLSVTISIVAAVMVLSIHNNGKLQK